MRASLTIGDFSQLTHLSVKTLRHYHEAGLLEPAEIDPHSGYRYYSAEQIPTAQVIRRFRELDMPVREVADVLATTDPDARSALIAEHLARLESQLDQTRAAVAALRRLLEPVPPAIQVEHRSTSARTVAAIGETVERGNVLSWYGTAMSEIEQAVSGQRLHVTGPPGGLYDNELFTNDRGDVLVYVPVAEPPAIGRIKPFIVPAAELAITVHNGPHDDIDVTYGRLGRYVADHEFAVVGPVHEIYLIGPRDTDESTAWRTEIGWPVFHTSASRSAHRR
ncbi:MerR family transcriptional regulator [Jatrophihabitans sp. DSM 45814]